MAESIELEIINCEQGSFKWFAARLGIPTASEFSTVMAKGKGAGTSKTREDYMLKLIGERMTGTLMENYNNKHMERGKELEAEARLLYAIDSDIWPETVGFMRRGRAGCSPDLVVGTKGLGEIKTKLPHLQLKVLFAGQLPPEHKAQTQGQLWIAEREWDDFISYWPGMPLFVFRVERDELYIKELASAVDEFNAEMDERMAFIEKTFGKHWLETKPRMPVDPFDDFNEVEE